MRQEFFNFEMNTNGQKLYEFTEQANDWVKKNSFKNHSGRSTVVFRRSCNLRQFLCDT